MWTELTRVSRCWFWKPWSYAQTNAMMECHTLSASCSSCMTCSDHTLTHTLSSWELSSTPPQNVCQGLGWSQSTSQPAAFVDHRLCARPRVDQMRFLSLWPHRVTGRAEHWGSDDTWLDASYNHVKKALNIWGRTSRESEVFLRSYETWCSNQQECCDERVSL